MNIVLKFLLFFIYLILIFISNHIFLLISLILFNIFMMILLKLEIKEFFKIFILLFPFLIITFLLNLIWDNLEISSLIFIRLVLAYIVTYIFSKLTSTSEMMTFVEIISKPLSIFKVNNKKIALMVGVSISMLPILKNEIEQKIYALKSKGYKFKIDSLNIVFKSIFISILKKTSEIEKSLIAKGYQE